MESDPISRVSLAQLPTPIEALPRLSALLKGPTLMVKRDDQTGLAFGGNKTRKLEFLVAAARRAEARTLITRGAAQSNHCRQTAAAAAKCGFDCTLVLAGNPPDDVTGNLLLHQLLGADLVWSRDEDPETTLQATYKKLEAEGKAPYLIPYGGSNPVGALAYAYALQEWLTQGQHADRIVFATSSGGTQAGLVLGAKKYGFQGRVTGISVDKRAEDLRPLVIELANATAASIGWDTRVEPGDVLIEDAYLGGGYGVISDGEIEAIRLFARAEGLMLDPVYTGRAAAGLLDCIRTGKFTPDEIILFWHTGGTPGLFAYADELSAG